jgi:hypothetical protein
MKRHEYFAGQDYPPTVDQKVLEDKTIIPYWFKSPDGLLKHQLKYMVTILQPTGEGIRLIVEVGRFFVTEDQVLPFIPMNADGKLCDIPIHTLVVGDLKFYAQIFGHDNMSSFWCMWCSKHPSK